MEKVESKYYVMMNKAFIFDMDGVLVDSERLWMTEETDLMIDVFGKDITQKIGDTMGVSVNEVYEQAVKYGTPVTKKAYLERFDEKARSIYARAALVDGSSSLVEKLLSLGFKLGIVSATQDSGIKQVLRQLPFRDAFDIIVSINDTSGLRSKPAPDGYLYALRKLGADPKQSIVLEDSNRGIESGKAAGCYVIGYRGHLVEGYEQVGADVYADTMDDVIRIVEKFQTSNSVS